MSRQKRTKGKGKQLTIAQENARRNRKLGGIHDPESGRGCGERRIGLQLADGRRVRVPKTLTADPEWREGLTGVAFDRLRCRHDFEFWAWRCVRIKDKITGADVAFVLNRPQRRLLEVFEAQRLAGKPIRVILLKSRQWGGSTLTQIYMAWIQIEHRRNWNSLICAHVKDTSAIIRAMYGKLLDNYPAEMWEEEGEPKFSAVAGTTNTRQIAGRGCNVTIGTYEKPESSRGSDIVMAHLSEVAFWRKTLTNDPDQLVQAVAGGIAPLPMSLIVLESTANGVGSYFHRQWIKAERGESVYTPVFVPWFEVDFNRRDVDDAARFHKTLSEAEKLMWERGLTLEQIAWYRDKQLEMGKVSSEHPATAAEAFASSGSTVFETEHVEALRGGCRDVEPDGGGVVQWSAPADGEEYVVSVDVGGRSAGSDYSVIAVVCSSGELPEVCAQWRGHIDYDMLAAKAAGMAREYNDALLVIESNTPENISARSGEPSVLLDVLGDTYPNFYRRTTGDGSASRPGFHMNRSTKAAVVSNLQCMVRDGAYIERDHQALDEMLTYEQQPSGSWGARSGCHDDVLMTRAIALYVIARRNKPEKIDFEVFRRGGGGFDDFCLL